MLPSLSAGTSECGRPQIVFERGIVFVIVIVIEPKLSCNGKFGGCVRKPPSRPEPGTYFKIGPTSSQAACRW